MTTDDDIRTLTAAYALGAVDAEEAAEFEALLERDPVLRAEVEELRATAADLAWTAEPVDPSPRLKVDIMAMLDATPQLPPLVAPSAATDDDRSPAPVTELRSATSGGAVTGAPATSSSPSRERLGSASARASERWFRKPGALIGVAAAAVVLVVGGVVVGTNMGGPGTSQAPVASAYEQVTTASDVVIDKRDVVGGGTATVYFSASEAKTAVVLNDASPLPEGRVLQMWYVGASGAVSAGVMPAADGAGHAVLDGSYTPGDTVAITVEPEGGSEQPTTEPIVAVTST
ncbi:anti-sigma factor [Clavibacter michiganensis]|uniref:anti-sigma factor n=1 Tax=Clavibacter michiganensis TaxID=28447 RepID=UPI0009A610FC|nr:anti-sigma factor [Clavibacter michiganensis]MBF4639123.1 anti-sigma factor [Clavibacter michiganensis subsp. michiganensis]MDO4124916.1 anti-sigma factor [Clavibacter michiganensis]MDO4139684.1 anti-sigma factor [Clavibacter michiganensis]MWJ07419.1 anti-sigma factor [Clavibacter michiganensis subsp. michiganensis]MWJ89842.1 anti-sigma factor [Clavibacter michiganensis subsp. michiganensis]